MYQGLCHTFYLYNTGLQVYCQENTLSLFFFFSCYCAPIFGEHKIDTQTAFALEAPDRMDVFFRGFPGLTPSLPSNVSVPVITA